MGRSCERLSLPPWEQGREDDGVATFRRCTRVEKVASLRRWLAICAGGVRRLRTWPRTVLVQAVQQLALVLCDDACDASPGLTLPTPSWFPTALLLAVAVTARAWAALPWEEATFCRELHTRPPWQACPGRIPLAEQRVLSVRSTESSTATSATSCRTRTMKLSHRRGG